MGKYIRGVVAVLCMTGFAMQVHAELEVLHDAGGTPLRSYLKSDKPKVKAPPPHAKTFSKAFYPVVTKSLSPGRLGPDEGLIDIPPLYKPMFIVGDDAVSLRWLAENRELLAERGALGMVVNVASPERLAAMQQVAGNGIVLTPISADSLAEALKIKHYPFYIDNDGILR